MQVAGFDGAVSYYKLAIACSYLRYRPSVRFVATNRDLTFPDTHQVHKERKVITKACFGGSIVFTTTYLSQVVPGGGVIIAAIEAGSGRSPDIVAGKPSIGLLDIIEAEGPGLNRGRTCMIGDRLDTDILFGNKGGLASTLLVLTGVSSLLDVEALPLGDSHRPTHVIASLGDLARLLQRAGVVTTGIGGTGSAVNS